MLDTLRYPFFITYRTKNLLVQKLHMNFLYEPDNSGKCQMRLCISIEE